MNNKNKSAQTRIYRAASTTCWRRLTALDRTEYPYEYTTVTNDNNTTDETDSCSLFNV